MQGDEARILLGFSPCSRPSSSQVKEAYKRKVWDTHPDLFPAHEKPLAESKFKLTSLIFSVEGLQTIKDGMVECVMRSLEWNQSVGVRCEGLSKGERAIRASDVCVSVAKTKE